MANNGQIQMSAPQIQAQLKNHWKDDLQSRWPRTSGTEERYRWLCNLIVTRNSLFQLVGITPYSLKIRRCIMSANMSHKEWQQRNNTLPESINIRNELYRYDLPLEDEHRWQRHNSHQGPQNWQNSLNENAISETFQD